MIAGGLPGALPAGERLLWQGRPHWRGLALRALHARKLAFYFAALLAWYVASSLYDGEPAGGVALAALKLGGLALAPLALIGLYAWLTQRATIYSITNRRVVIRMGIALPMTLNLPFARIEAADLHVCADGSGDIALRLTPAERIAYPILWPHARPWRLARAEPMLRAVPKATAAAQILARALAASASAPISVVADARPPARSPQHAAPAAA